MEGGGRGNSGAFDAVIMASPAWAAGVLLSGVDATLGEDLARDSLLVFDHREPDLRRGEAGRVAGWLRLSGSGKRRPRDAGLHLCASQVSGADAAGKVVLRAFLGGMKNEALLAESDEVLVGTVRRELAGDSGREMLDWR